ncbi:hypothetical protein GWI33_016858 [Rhynchophorus ferrugineus]|uniref:Uncharacterized protein n=1 Tax=Rhynchophorus ferrugineus TaxID=354439 RepID=A0A834I032_RHYFE|nr:hypothetical protein GWI33_016858 [Rhynchophorus ferrugineus]
MPDRRLSWAVASQAKKYLSQGLFSFFSLPGSFRHGQGWREERVGDDDKQATSIRATDLPLPFSGSASARDVTGAIPRESAPRNPILTSEEGEGLFCPRYDNEFIASGAGPLSLVDIEAKSCPRRNSQRPGNAYLLRGTGGVDDMTLPS